MENSMISVSALLNHILKKWRKIFLIAIVFAVIFGGYKFYDMYTMPQEEVAAVNDPEYYAKLEEYTALKVAIENKIAPLQAAVDTAQDYVDSSMFMKVDYKSIDRMVVAMNIVLPEDEAAKADALLAGGQMEKILSEYQFNMLESDMFSQINTQLSYNIDERYIREFVTYWHGVEQSSMSITIRSDDLAKNAQIAEIVTEYFGEFYATVNATYPHELNIAVPTSSIISDDGVLELQQSRLAQLESAKEQLSVPMAELETLEEPVATQQTSTTITTRQMLTQSVIFAIIGGFGGFFLSVAFIAFCPILTNKMQDGKYVADEYGLFVFGKKPEFINGKNIIDKLFFKATNRSSYKSEDEFWDYVATNINLLNTDKKAVYLTSSLDAKTLEQTAESLKSRMDADIDFGENVTENSQTVKSLADAQFIVLVEKSFKTTDSDLNKETKLIKKLGKEIKGAIVL